LAKGNLWIGLVIAAIIYFLLIVYGDSRAVLFAISSFDLRYMPVLIGLAFTNYLLRAVKWHYFFRVLSMPMGWKENLYVFFSGLMMAITPGKFGEVWKSWLIKDLKGYDLHKTMPVIFADRMTDVIAVMTLASFGVFLFRMNVLSFTIVILVLAGLILLLRSELVMLRAFDRFDTLREAYLISRPLLDPKPLTMAIGISIISWFMECLAFYMTFRGFSIGAGLFESTFIYAFSSVAGALTMLPGGLGVTEASMTVLSTKLLALDRSSAVAATLIIRAVTLWFAVIVGAATYFTGRRILCQRSAS
jgi:uncharacterized membrane protein YbhN (UPF0104 family)